MIAILVRAFCQQKQNKTCGVIIPYENLMLSILRDTIKALKTLFVVGASFRGFVSKQHLGAIG